MTPASPGNHPADQQKLRDQAAMSAPIALLQLIQTTARVPAQVLLVESRWISSLCLRYLHRVLLRPLNQVVSY